MIVPPDEYYIRRPVTAEFDDYWEKRTDPDGVLRDRLSEAERRQYLHDVDAELSFLRCLPPGRILDVGCGPGWFLSALHPEWDTFGTEVCKTAIDVATGLGVQILVSSVKHRECFDVVRCHHVIEHMHQPIHELMVMRSMLKPCGWFLLSTPDFGGPAAARFHDRYRMLHDTTHCSLFTLESLHRFVRDHGFTVRKVDYPFPQRHATEATMDRWRSGEGTSPPWPGSWVTMYCTK